MIEVTTVENLPPGATTRIEAEGRPICVANIGGAFYAVHDTCTHALEGLSGGYIEDGKIECPRHGAFFDLASGVAATPPATLALPTFRCEVHDGRIFVDPTPSHPHPLLERKEFQARG